MPLWSDPGQQTFHYASKFQPPTRFPLLITPSCRLNPDYEYTLEQAVSSASTVMSEKWRLTAQGLHVASME